ncbi:hypothetical protein [Microbacterium dauci]|uniref:Uncharacterized protein n=1 Tax=Microbacterium dauci TaxID=3048008 RepID=A0ABT6ZBB6_9MICO|nr:hypothetical protein [Microbacterium sp. LX3-4]MDJ1113233.1 hypothetical protein [Microbacterium sp. LX3-4]
MAITFAEISEDEELGRRVLSRARLIAPCLDSLDPDTEPGRDAIAILRGVVAELPATGQSRMRSLSRNGTAITLAAIASAFEGDAEASLRAICGAVTNGGAQPRGSFPATSPIAGLWPEGRYS